MSKDVPQNALSNKHIYIARALTRAEKIKSKNSGHFNLANLIFIHGISVFTHRVILGVQVSFRVFVWLFLS